MVRHSVPETYENDTEFDLTYMVLVFVTFLPTLILPWFYAHWILIGKVLNRKYLIINRGPGFLTVVWFGSSSCVSPVEFNDEKGGGGERGTLSYDREKAWLSINHSILSVYDDVWNQILLLKGQQLVLQADLHNTQFL